MAKHPILYRLVQGKLVVASQCKKKCGAGKTCMRCNGKSRCVGRTGCPCPKHKGKRMVKGADGRCHRLKKSTHQRQRANRLAVLRRTLAKASKLGKQLKL